VSDARTPQDAAGEIEGTYTTQKNGESGPELAEEALLNVLRRLDKLEAAVQAVDEEADIIVFFWPETPHEVRKRLRAEVRARIAPEDYRPGGVYWPDGTPISPP